MVLPQFSSPRSSVISSDSNSSHHSSKTISSMGIELPTEYHKTVFVVIFLAAAGISNFAVLAYIHDFSGRTALPDLVFRFIKQQPWALRVGDAMVMLCGFSAILVFIFHKHRNIVTRRSLFIIGILYFLRALSMLFTQLPPPYIDNEDRCRRQLKVEEGTWKVYLGRMMEQTINVGFQDMEDKMLCGDVFFSGHTFIMVTCYLIVSYYLPEDKKFIRYIPGAAACIGATCMIISRSHYTIDVLFAYFLSVFVFYIYHSFCQIEKDGKRRNSILSEFFLMRIAFWLEENVVPGEIENAYNLPFSSLIQKVRVKARRQQQIDYTMSNLTSRASMAEIV